MSEPAHILVVDDDNAFRISTAALLRADGHRADVARDAHAAVSALASTRYDLLLLDLRMPGIDGVSLLETLRLRGEGVLVLMISGFGTVNSAVRAMHAGADDFLTKPVEPALLCARVAELLERRPPSLTDHVLDGLVGRSRAMREVALAVRRVAPTDSTVLITGETGTGKEVVAAAVHGLSRRRSSAFLPVNCGALSEGLLESELFGHVRGAFTGAVRDRAGVFEASSGGTIFLDEVGEMSLPLQLRLLRVLQEREITRVGTTYRMSVDVRVIAATHCELGVLVRAGRFREDLLYRLAGFQIDLPPLRARPSDIPLLVEHALERLRTGAPERRRLACAPGVMRALRGYDWPGNVRQLLMAMESAAIQADFGRIEVQHLPAMIRGALEERSATPRYHAVSEMDERAAIVAALEHTDGVLSRAAELLGMGRTTLWRRLKSYGLTEYADPGGSLPSKEP
jgi:DNA-binding NtrC family response regulator